MPNYTPQAIEPRWQKYWLEHRTFATPDSSAKPKYYILDMFPYPVGRRPARRPSRRLHRDRHPRPLQADARLRTSCTRWAGTPSACRPSSTPSRPARIRATRPQKNIDTFRRQIKMLGFSYDWDREVDTTDPNYFRWTQWIFLQLFDTWYDAEAEAGRPIARAADSRR